MNLARSNSRGISAIGFALVLPFALITIFAAFQFFLYMRAVATVQRAAAEAGQVLASSIPTSSSSSSGQILHSLPATSTKEFYASESGGDTEGDINASFAKHGTLYLRPDAGADPTDRTVLPFYFDRTRNPEDAAAADPGPMYLPMVRVWTCKDTYTDESNALSSCYTMSHSELSSDRNHAGFLTYQLPNMMDFDGDGREDIAIFDANASGDNWFVLTSSSGLLFRNAIRVDLGVANSSAGLTGGARWLPCPADYDGDGMTDFCIATVESGTAKARVRFSTMLYRYHQEFTLATGLSAQLLLPQPGNWGGTKQQFAAVLTETTSDTERLATYVWPEFTTTGNGVHSDTCYAISSDSGDRTMHTSSRTKPRYGRMWRPMFGDHDGDTKLDISFLEWPGGAITGHVAGASRGLQDFSSGPVDPSTALMSPWKLEEYFPVSGESGLYIVEKDNHRVTLIKRSTGGAVVGGSSESLMLIAGGTPSGVNYTDVTPAPHSRGYRTTQHSLVPISSSDDCSSLGAPYDSEGCCRDTMCPPGGGFSGDGGAPTSATLDTPMDVAVIGDNLFIADKGTYRVRMIYNDASGDTDDIVDGDAGERIYTVAGGEPYTNYADYHGVNPAATYCTDIHGVGPNGNFGRQSYHNGNGVACPTGHGWNWSCYEEEGGYDQEQYGVHPYCLLLSPVALEPAFGKSLSGRGLYIADEFGVIYLYHNHDGVFDPWNDTAERIFRVGGDIPANLFTDEFGSPTMTNGLDLTSTTMGAAVDLTNVANTRLLATINDFRPGHSTSNGGR